MEEDIKILENFIIKPVNNLACAFIDIPYPIMQRSIRSLLTRYKQQKAELESVKEIYYTEKDMQEFKDRIKQLEKENKKWEEWAENAECDMSVNYIPKSKIKEKIEEFKERNCSTCGKCKNSDEYEELYNNYISCDVGMVINTLQELLEREGK